ncbi:MAG TPA: hypothetical protein VGH03_16135 [Caulobacteraceae bacterium]
MFELVYPEAPQGNATRPVRMTPAPSLSALAPPDVSVALQRPLFTPTRSPPGAAPLSVGPQRLEDFRLAGSIRSERGTLAVLTLADGSTTTVRPGSTLLGWRVESIGAEGVRLRSGDATRLIPVSAGQAVSVAPIRAMP